MNVMPTMQRQASATETANDLINICIAAASRDSQKLTAGCRLPLNPVEYSRNSTHSTHLHDASNCKAPASGDTISNSQNTRTSHRGDCTICLENPVNSVLYRCGHMCMCHDCAMEHFNVKGENICPVCRAPIVDIIQTFTTTWSISSWWIKKQFLNKVHAWVECNANLKAMKLCALSDHVDFTM